MNNNKENAQQKIEALAKVMKVCGLEVCLTEPDDDCTSVLIVTTNSAKNSSETQFEVWADKYSDYEIECIVNPVEEIAEMFAEMITNKE